MSYWYKSKARVEIIQIHFNPEPIPPPAPPEHHPTSSTFPSPSTAPSVPSFLIDDVGRAPPPPRLHSHSRGLQKLVDNCFPTSTVSAWLTARYVSNQMSHSVVAYLN